jgi:hypothetical protein
MNYIERVLPSLGEDAVTLRPIGGVAADVVRLRGERLDAPARPRSRAACGWPSCSAGWRTSHRGWTDRAPAHHQGPRPGAARRVLARSGPTVGHHKLNLGPARRRAGAAERAVAGPPDRPRPGARRVRRHGHRHRRSSSASWTRGGPRSPRPTLCPGSPTALWSAGCRAACCPTPSATCWRPATPTWASGPDWTVADGALLDELVHLLGPVPEPRSRRSRCSSTRGRRGAEVVTTADRLAVRRRWTRSRRARDVRAHPGRRGAGHLARCSGGCSAAAAERQLDDRRRSRLRAPGPDAAEADRAITEMVGHAHRSASSG